MSSRPRNKHKVAEQRTRGRKQQEDTEDTDDNNDGNEGIESNNKGIEGNNKNIEGNEGTKKGKGNRARAMRYQKESLRSIAAGLSSLNTRSYPYD